jgi:hypothetical protein
MSNIQVVEKTITIDNPGTGEPITVNLELEIQVADCECTPARTGSPGNPPGWTPAKRRR